MSERPQPPTAARTRRKRRSLQPLRYAIQTAVALYVLVIVVAGTVGSSWAANLHTICPFGGLVNLYTFLAEGEYVAKLHSAVFIMLLALIIGLVLTGKAFCGWICPLGSVQQGLNAIGQRLWPRLYNRVPRSVEHWLQYLKWVVLVWVLVQTARSGRLIFEDWDPYFNLFHIWSDTIAWSGYLVVALTIITSLFVPRAFCRFGCPLGAFNGLFNSFSLLTIRRDAPSCTSCGRCDSICPVNIPISEVTSVNSVECIRCLKCVESCLPNTRTGCTLKVRTWLDRLGARDGVRRWPIPNWVLAVVAVAAFAIPIVVANVSGDFVIAGRGGGSAGVQDGTGAAVQDGGGRGEGGAVEDHEEFEGGEALGDGQTIRGRTTLGEIQALVKDFEDFLDEFDIPEDEPSYSTLGDLMTRYGFDMSEVRAYVARNSP